MMSTARAIWSTDDGCGLTMTGLPVARLAKTAGYTFQDGKLAHATTTAGPSGTVV